MVTERPRARSRWPRLEAVSPFPREDATPPVTKMCLVVCDDLGKRELVRCTTEFEPITFPAAPGSDAALPAADRTLFAHGHRPCRAPSISSRACARADS